MTSSMRLLLLLPIFLTIVCQAIESMVILGSKFADIAINNDQPKVACVGHRGFSAIYPENTMLSYRKAVEAGANGLELDVHMTRDNVVVLLHDDLLDRTTTGHGFVWNRDYQYVKRLKTRKFLRIYRESVPRFDQVLELMMEFPYLQVMVDIKATNPLEIIDQMVADMQRYVGYDFSRQLTFGCWEKRFVRRANSMAPGFATSHISKSLDLSRDEFFDDVDNYSVRYETLVGDDGGDFLSLVRSSSRQPKRTVFVWTVNRITDMQRAISIGVDAILSDSPDICVLVRSQFQARQLI